MSGIVRTGVNATRFGVVVAQVAGCGFYAYASDFLSRVCGIIKLCGKRMKVDVSVGTIVRAQAATDTPVFDDDLKSIAAPNRADRATDHAERIAALAARSGHQVLIEAQTLADQSADALMCVGTGPHALVATRALLQVENEEALRFHQSLGEELVYGNVLRLDRVAQILFDPLAGNGSQFVANFWKAIKHELEIFARDAHDFHMVESGTRRGARAAAEQRDFTEIAAACEVGKHQFAAALASPEVVATVS